MSAIVLRGLGYGDEGKGTITDFLAHRLDIKHVSRDNGGSQAIHQVVLGSGRVHKFSQFSSATFQKGATTFLSKGMAVNPSNLLEENRVLQEKGIGDAMARITIDPDCAIITPLHKMLCQMQEVARGKARHGSTGMGVGQAIKDREELGQAALRMGDMLEPARLVYKLAQHFSEKLGAAAKIIKSNPGNDELRKMFWHYQEWITFSGLLGKYARFGSDYGQTIRPIQDLTNLIDEGMIFEGAQGTMLDPKICPPFVTKTQTTAQSALNVIGNGTIHSRIKKVGILRAYYTRHGAGPFVTESTRLSRLLPDSDNVAGYWQGQFRVGWFDTVAAKFAIEINEGIDSIALTNLDRLSEFSRIPVYTAYEYRGNRPDLLDDLFEWRYQNGAYLTERMKTGPRADKSRSHLAGILFDCKPAGKIVMDGWRSGIGNVKRYEDLPSEAIKYIEFLQSADGFDVPISVVSVGERRDQKFTLFDPCE